MAQTLSAQERQFVIDLLETNSKIFLDDILEVSEEQWKFKPASDGWSVADVSEHITLSEELLLSIVQKTLQGDLDPISYHLVHLSTILKYIGQKYYV